MTRIGQGIPQPVAKGHEDQRGVAVAVTPELRGRDQLLDLFRAQHYGKLLRHSGQLHVV